MSRPSQKERNELIYKLHNKSKSFFELSKMFKVSKRAVWEAYWKVAVRKGVKPPPSAKKMAPRWLSTNG